MTTRTAPRFTAFAFALAMTLAMLAGIDNLATGGPAGAQWAAASTPAAKA
jgi:hypothetical protein